MKNLRAGYIWLLLLLLGALIALPALATEDDPVKDAVSEPAPVTVHVSDPVPANIPDEPAPATLENDETAAPAPDPDAVDGQVQTPVEEAGEEGGQDDGQAGGEGQAVEEVPEVVFHTVVFVGQNNAILETQRVEDGKRAEEPNDPAAPDGYAFAHWYDDAGNGQAFEFTTPIAGDMKLRAKYVEVVTAPAEPEPEEEEPGSALPGGEPQPEEEEPGSVLPGEEPEPAPEEGEPESELPEEEQPEVVSGPPRVEVEYAFEGDVLLEGTKVTLTAHVYNIPEDTVLTFQWQNDATGRFEDVSGATERTYTFYADADNSGCQWRVRVEGQAA